MIEFDAGHPIRAESLRKCDAWAYTLSTLTGQMVTAPPSWPNGARHVHRIGDEGRDSLDSEITLVARPSRTVRAPAHAEVRLAGLAIIRERVSG